MSEAARYAVFGVALLVVSVGLGRSMESGEGTVVAWALGVVLSPLVPVYVRWNTRGGRLRHSARGGMVASGSVGVFVALAAASVTIGRSAVDLIVVTALTACGVGSLITMTVVNRWWPSERASQRGDIQP